MVMNRPLKLLLVLTLLCQPLFADVLTYYPDEIDSSFNNNNVRDRELVSAVRRLLTKKHVKQSGGRADLLVDRCSGQRGHCYSQKTLGYREARRHLFGNIHLREDHQGYYIRDVYCGKKFSNNYVKEDDRWYKGRRKWPKGGLNIGPMKIPNNTVLNCEHTWPQSRFNSSFSKSTQKTDLHHLFPTDSKANSARGSFKFAEVEGEAAYPGCDSSRRGSPIPPVYKLDGILKANMYFEPDDSFKGNVARALFYFSIRYNLRLTDTEEYYLKKWHQEDPVDEEEETRNSMVEELQYNRNPFIDYPGIVERISDF